MKPITREASVERRFRMTLRIVAVLIAVAAVLFSGITYRDAVAISSRRSDFGLYAGAGIAFYAAAACGIVMVLQLVGGYLSAAVSGKTGLLRWLKELAFSLVCAVISCAAAAGLIAATW